LKKNNVGPENPGLMKKKIMVIGWTLIGLLLASLLAIAILGIIETG